MACQRFKVPAAEAFLYERLGNINAALQIFVDQALSAVQTLIELVQAAHLPDERFLDLLDDRMPHSQLLPRSQSREFADQNLSLAVRSHCFLPYLISSFRSLFHLVLSL